MSKYTGRWQVHYSALTRVLLPADVENSSDIRCTWSSLYRWKSSLRCLHRMISRFLKTRNQQTWFKKTESFCNLGRLHFPELVLRGKWRKIHRGADGRLAQKLKPVQSLAFTTLFVEKKGWNHLTTMALQELHNWKMQNCRVCWWHVLICRNKLN